MQRHELRQPSVAELCHIGQRVAGECGQKFLMRGGPGKLLHLDADARMLALEIRHQLANDLALAAHRPEAHDGVAARALAAPAEARRHAEQHDEKR